MTKRNSKSRALTDTRFALTPLAAAVVAAMNPAASALAQESDDDVLEEIITTATKREMNLQDVAQSITAFSTAEIERRQILDMADVAVNLPSISLSTQRAGRNELVYRGMSTGGDWRLDSQVAMYLDEMPMTMSTTQLDARLVDIDRVESLPGPQGTLFGSSSQSGTLRVVTNKPQFDAFSGKVSGDLKSTEGGEESYDVNAHLNIPVSDNFAIRIVAFSNKEGGYIDNVFSTTPHSVCNHPAGTSTPDNYTCDHDFWGLGSQLGSGHLNSATPDNAGLEEKDYNDYEMSGGRISALWNINEDWSLLTNLMHQDSETTGVWFSDTAIGDYKVARFSDEWRKDRWSTAQFTLEGDLGFAVLTESFGYAERKQTYHFDNTHYEAYHTRLKGQYWSTYYNYYYDYYDYYPYNYYDKYDTNYLGGVYRSLQDAERITNELRLTSKGDSRFQWMIGAFYENNKDGWIDAGEIPGLTNTKHWDYTQFRSCELEGQGFPVECPTPPLNDIWYIDNYDRDITQIATFGEVSYDLTEKLELTAGLRWFEYDRLVISDQQWPPGLPVEGILLDGESVFIEEGTDSDTSVKLAVSYTLDDDKMIYALYSEGFRLGGHNNPKAVRVNFVPQTYDPDVLTNYEAGIKSEWLDNRLQLNATVFYMTWDDIQLNIDSDQSGLWWLTGQDNGGGGRNLGLEVNFDWHATQNLRLSGNVYAGDAYYTDDYITMEDVQELTAGTQMPDSASEKFSLAVDYSIPNVFGGDMWLRYDFYSVGSMFSSLSRADEANPASPDFVPGSKENVESFTKSNFQIGYVSADGGWNATLMVRNLFDAKANTFTGTGTQEYAEYWGHTGFGPTNTLARPRTYSIRLTKNF